MLYGAYGWLPPVGGPFACPGCIPPILGFPGFGPIPPFKPILPFGPILPIGPILPYPGICLGCI
ncbi:MAG: hypothetical protein JWN15_1032 [Firmicutes bacterium]|nr:hypothetical protein [Bacillota bacterium]